jgi:hypothetical protein
MTVNPIAASSLAALKMGGSRRPSEVCSFSQASAVP